MRLKLIQLASPASIKQKQKCAYFIRKNEHSKFCFRFYLHERSTSAAQRSHVTGPNGPDCFGDSVLRLPVRRKAQLHDGKRPKK